MSSRDTVLGRVRDALGAARGTQVPVPRGYRRRLTGSRCSPNGSPSAAPRCGT
jgi:hypothetical protein